MPLKSFASKAFPRRKSSGNALEDFNQPSEGFRVLSQYEVAERNHERQERQEKERTKSTLLSGVRPFTLPAQKGRNQSFEEDSGTSNRYMPSRAPLDAPQLTHSSGSNSSSGANSALSRVYDTSSSARFSSSSTLPSSTDQENDDLFGHKHPVNDHSFSIRGAARTFTFGGKNQKSLPPKPGRQPPSPEDDLFSPPYATHARERSLTTTSSASTAHPPKVDTSLSLGMGDFGGEFDDIFTGLDKRKSARLDDLPRPTAPGIFRSESEPMLAVPPKAFASSRQLQTPDPLRLDNSKEIEPSPHSWDSRDSNEGLMSSPDSSDSLMQDPPPVPQHRQLTPSSSPSNTSRLAAPAVAVGVNRKPISKPSSSRALSDNSISFATSNLKSPPSQAHYSPIAIAPTPAAGLFDSDESSQVSSEATARPNGARTASPETDFMAAVVNAGNRPTVPGPKVMNQAQFNRYREHKELEDAKEPESESEASDGDYEDDEEERTKELQRQRRKQEGHLAVWRQKMHKVTGEKPLPFQRTSMDRPISQADVLLGGAKKEQSDEDEADEETPLAILMAHGFPTKTRPPTKPSGPYTSRLPESHSTSDLRLSMGPQSLAPPNARPASSHGQRPPSIAGSVADKRSSTLPPFARHLPQDPYFGASLVSAPNRESLAFGHGGAGSVYGGPSVPPQNTSNTTLVNVIANEERAKAMRRGSPNAQVGFGPQMNQQPAPANHNMGMPGMNPMQMQMPTGGMHMASQSADMTQAMAQLMLNQQMLQQQLAQSQALMMQMASGGMNPQMMQQMHQMQQTPPMQQQMPMQMPNQQQPGAFGAQNRPMSMYSVGMRNQRAVSMVQPPQLPPMPSQQSAHGFTPSISLIPPPSNGYTPSIAPSERSTVGMARRYRPVSHMPGIDGGSSVSSSTMHAFQQPPIIAENTTSSVANNSSGSNSNANSRPTSKGAKKSILAVLKRSNKENETNDEEDEEGWGALNTRKSKWLGKSDSGAAAAGPSAGLRELYVDGI